MINDKDQNWFALEITINAEASEAVEFGLNELGALGTEINHLGKKASEPLCVVGYFNELPDEKIVQTELNEALRIYKLPLETIVKIDSHTVENADWLHEWKKHWKPTVTEKFIVAPTWETIENTDKIIVRIEPSMAFGTGTHETTRLCLQAIESEYENGMSFLDVGTGTGILAIAAVLKSQNPKFDVVGCDTDFDSITIAKENADLNKVENIDFFVGSISAETPKFDFVCANLTADVIVPILPLLLEKAKRILVLSGILQEQESAVRAELVRLGVENAETQISGEWISVIVKKWKVENGK
jgi:ribosomal protein L11 methyltransferase